jgi:ketosteroid isomerase-like protein
VLPSDFEQAVEQYHRTIDAVGKGDAEPQKRLFSRGDDVTLANPLGPPVRGWKQVSEALDRAASQMHGGEPITTERVSAIATRDMGYVLEIERMRVKFPDSDELRPVALRVTTIWLKENGEWRVVHRHADPITSARTIQSTAEQSPTAQTTRA